VSAFERTLKYHLVSYRMQDYSVSMYLRQNWTDPRLRFEPEDFRQKTKIRLGNNSWNAIWIPDTFFRNEKSARFHKVTAENRMLTLEHTGNLWYVIK